MTQDARFTLTLSPRIETDLLTVDPDPTDRRLYDMTPPQDHGDFLGLYPVILNGSRSVTYHFDPGLSPSLVFSLWVRT